MASSRNKRIVINSDDSYHTDDDKDKDADYPPAAKKKRIKTNQRTTNRQRIERLKRISEKYSNKNSVVNSTTSLIENEEAVFTTNGKQNSTGQNAENSNYDKYFIDDCNLDNIVVEEIPAGEVIFTTNVITAEKSVPSLNNNPELIVQSKDNRASEPDLIQLILANQCQLTSLIDYVMQLRKQVARLELKLSGCSDVRAQAKSGNIVDMNDLLDLEASLAREGLPLRTCVETIEFEKKLRAESDYRNKLVKKSNVFFVLLN